MQRKAKVITAEKKPEGNFLTLQVNGNLPPVGEWLSIKWGRKRTNQANSLYWVWLTWILENGMEEQGYVTPDEIHSGLKGHFLAKKKKDKAGLTIIFIGSTTDLDTKEFAEYFDKCDTLINTFFNISTAGFWQEYGENYGRG